MQEKIDQFKAHVIEASSSPEFVHNKWFVKWHLEIVERLAAELLESYPEADKDLVNVMVWLHDYGKILDFDSQYDMTLTAGKEKLLSIGFEEDFVTKAVGNIEILDKKMEVDLNQTSIEIKIISSADGCSHMVGPFMALWWYENAHKSIDELLKDNMNKVKKDWERKIVLPEARRVFEQRQIYIRENSGELPEKFLS